MENKFLSNSLKGLLIIFALFSLAVAFYIMPILADQLSIEWTELAHLKMPFLVLSQILLIMFVGGLLLIVYLLILFDQGKVFTTSFTKVLNFLSVLCFVASLSIAGVFIALNVYGGPGPGGLLVLVPIFFIIIIIGIALHLFAKVINQAIIYKEENDLTV